MLLGMVWAVYVHAAIFLEAPNPTEAFNYQSMFFTSLLLVDIPFVAFLVLEKELNATGKALWILVACCIPVLGWVACWFSRMLPQLKEGGADAI